MDGPPGSFDRTHHHPGISRGLEPGRRVFDADLSAAPVEWVVGQLADLEALLDQAGVGGDPADAADAQSLRDCLHEVLESLDRLLERVQVGELGRPLADGAADQRPGGLAVARLRPAGRESAWSVRVTHSSCRRADRGT